MPAVRLRVWFRFSVRIRARGQFSSWAIFLEPSEGDATTKTFSEFFLFPREVGHNKSNNVV